MRLKAKINKHKEDCKSNLLVVQSTLNHLNNITINSEPNVHINNLKVELLNKERFFKLEIYYCNTQLSLLEDRRKYPKIKDILFDEY